MNAESQRDRALVILDGKLPELSSLFRKCYLSSGRGAVMVYASDIIDRRGPKMHHYRSSEEVAAIFDAPASRARLMELIDGYNPRKEGVLVLITDYSNATYFVTVKLEYRH